jgi:uncharacterized membrane protein
MDDKAQDVLVASFPTEDGGKKALEKLQQAKKDGVVEFRDAAILKRDASSNKLMIAETADKGFGKGAAIGGVAGAAVGLLAGPIGWAALGGAAVGGLAAKLKDGGVPDDRLKQLGERIPAGSSAMLAVVEHGHTMELEGILKQSGAQVVKEMVAEDMAKALDAEAERHQGGQG